MSQPFWREQLVIAENVEKKKKRIRGEVWCYGVVVGWKEVEEAGV